MSCVVIRNKKNMKDTFPISISDEARQRFIEYLKSIGIRVEDITPLIWPEDAVSAYRKYMYAPWQFTTHADIRRKRQEDAKHVLRFKREYGVSKRQPLYVWVFWCPGISGFFEGWWTYLIGNNISYCLNFRNNDKETITRLMQLFPLVESTPFSPLDLDEWMAEFVNRYQRGNWGGKPQGKSPVWARVRGGHIEEILKRAEWPSNDRRLDRTA